MSNPVWQLVHGGGFRQRSPTTSEAPGIAGHITSAVGKVDRAYEEDGGLGFAAS